MVAYALRTLVPKGPVWRACLSSPGALVRRCRTLLTSILTTGLEIFSAPQRTKFCRTGRAFSMALRRYRMDRPQEACGGKTPAQQSLLQLPTFVTWVKPT
jgi:hypothetical protein